MVKFNEIPEEVKAHLKDCAHNNKVVAMKHQYELAMALQLPLREGMLNGDNRGGIFEPIPFDPSTPREFPLDFLTPGTEDDFVAYVIPSHGKLAERRIQSDYLTIPTFEIGNSITWLLRYAKYARWDVVGRAMEVLEAGFTKKMNDDAWAVLLGAGVDRNIVIYDAAAADAQFTKRLVSLAKLAIRRNGGGNSTSVNRGKLTDLFLSPEGMEDMRNWNIDQVDEVTRREIYVAGDDTVKRVFSVNLHDMDEFGVAQQYQRYYAEVLGGTMQGTDVEVAVGLDLSKSDAFVMPVVDNISVNPYDTLFEQRKQGYWATAEVGFGCLDNRRVILLSY